MRKGMVVSGKDIFGKSFSVGIIVDKAPFSVDVVKVKDYQNFYLVIKVWSGLVILFLPV